MTHKNDRVLSVKELSRVEGEGALYLRASGGRVEEARLDIFEPPRFFEAFLRGRMYTEAPDITARICGICPVAYQMSAVHAMELAYGITVDGALRELRRLLYCGEWIESHALHVYLLHTPDFLGYPDAVHMAKDDPETVKRGLALKKAGNAIMQLLGGREIHPINVRVGGFYRVPSREELETLRPILESALEIAEETVHFAAGLPFPDAEEDYEFVALQHPDEYAMNEGDIVSSRGLRTSAAQFDEAFERAPVAYTHALQSVRKGGTPYLVGALARYALNGPRLSTRARSVAREVGLEPVVRNPFRSILVRGIELVYACEEALRIISEYRPPGQAWVEPTGTFHGGVCAAVTEAPRGLLYHRYHLAADGRIEAAEIIAPTAQNQKRIEEDVRHVVERSLAMDDAHLTDLCERAIRNHDPCISCATHFLKLEMERT
jgi:sulfhydrogenase subunit alpha